MDSASGIITEYYSALLTENSRLSISLASTFVGSSKIINEIILYLPHLPMWS